MIIKVKRLFVTAFILITLSCKNESTEQVHYKISECTIDENQSFAKVTINACLDTSVPEPEKEKYLWQMYDFAKSKKFKNHDKATQIWVYLFSSEKKLQASNSAFEIMLSESSGMAAKIERNMNSVISSNNEDEKYYEDIKSQMSQHGVDLCDYYFQWQKITKDAWGVNSSDRGEAWEISEHNKLKEKYGLSEELAGLATLVAGRTCK